MNGDGLFLLQPVTYRKIILTFYRPVRVNEQQELHLRIENKCLKTPMKVISKELKVKEV